MKMLSEYAEDAQHQGGKMSKSVAVIAALLLAGCGKFNDMVSTGVDGYVVRCIDGTQYVLLTSEHGLAITPHLATDGKPRGCQ